ncbi:MAG: hypothetical protein IPK82_17215 [Polyangiaceae bacterium]|nr:hypothetical protein [Polyangiaceae bacterium]
MILYRPVGIQELVLIFNSALRAFPPRLPEQPIFYPVLTFDYAEQIASRWNTKEGSGAGYVTEFFVEDGYASQLPVRQAGSKQHLEFWVDAAALDEFNGHIVGQIRLVACYFGSTFTGLVEGHWALGRMSARDMLGRLGQLYKHGKPEFAAEVAANKAAVFVYYPFWEQFIANEASSPDVEVSQLLQSVRQVWEGILPEIPLGVRARESYRQT